MVSGLDAGMLDRSPGALYPTNRALRASQRLLVPRFVGDEDAQGGKENVMHPGAGLAAGQETRKPAQAAPHAARARDRLDVVCSAISHPECMRRCGWRHVVRLRAASAALKSWIESGEDAWRTLAACLADDAGLYMPAVLPECASGKWKNYFFDHLFPARHKWHLDSLRISDHKIKVAVRFKPGTQRDRQVVLPLHQRLKMLKKGEKITAEEAAGEKGVSVEELKAQLVTMAGGDLDADVLEMLQDAQNLQHAATRAQTDANNQERRLLDKWDSDAGPGAGGGAADHSGNAAAHAAGGTNVAGDGGAGGGGASSASSQAAVQAEDDTETQRRRSGRSRVLTVERSRVVAFVPGVGVRPFNFAHVFNKDASQEALYRTFAEGAVLCALNGFNACVLAYGQTGSGKTFSLFGPPGWLGQLQGGAHLASCHGIVPRSVCELLSAAQRMSEAGVARISVSAQYLQVYREAVTCLGSGSKVVLRSGGSAGSFSATGAEEMPIDTPQQLLDVLERGEEFKRYGATAMNDRSSRAHTVLVLNLTHVRPSSAESQALTGDNAGGEIVKSQLLLADLAGCEHINKSKVVGDARKEAASINSGLLVLKKCISALNEEKSHVPFLESKLTMLLKGALGGSSRTFALVTGSLDEVHGDETVEAMRFGEQCAGVTNQTRIQASSLPAALTAIDKALAVCQQGLDSLAARGKCELAAFKALQAKHAALSRKREDLAGKQRQQLEAAHLLQTR